MQTQDLSTVTSLCVGDIMSRDVITVACGTPLREVADILTGNFISGAPVVDAEQEVVGIVSLTDLASRPADEHLTLRVEDVCTQAAFVIHEEATLPQLAQLLSKARIHRALVTAQKKVVGIVTTMDLIRVIPRMWTELEVAR